MTIILISTLKHIYLYFIRMQLHQASVASALSKDSKRTSKSDTPSTNTSHTHATGKLTAHSGGGGGVCVSHSKAGVGAGLSVVSSITMGRSELNNYNYNSAQHALIPQGSPESHRRAMARRDLKHERKAELDYLTSMEKVRSRLENKKQMDMQVSLSLSLSLRLKVFSPYTFGILYKFFYHTLNITSIDMATILIFILFEHIHLRAAPRGRDATSA